MTSKVAEEKQPGLGKQAVATIAQLAARLPSAPFDSPTADVSAMEIGSLLYLPLWLQA